VTACGRPNLGRPFPLRVTGTECADTVRLDNEDLSMKPIDASPGISRRLLLSTLAVLPAGSAPLFSVSAQAQTAPPGGGLPSWNDGPAKRAIVAFVQATTIDKASPKFVPPEERIATFDQDGTLWVEHPMYTFMTYALERVPALAKAKPGLKEIEPFKTVLSGNREAMAKFTTHDLEEILGAALTGMTVDEFKAEVQTWLTTAKHPRWNRPYTELAYQPMLEVLQYLRANGYKTYIVTGGRPGFCAHGVREGVRHPARTRCRNRFCNEVWLRKGWQADTNQGAQTHVVRRLWR
jgi:haloacid dehalogenase-like hydrolase